MKNILLLLSVFLTFTFAINSQEIPLVFSVENSGDACPIIPKKTLEELPSVLTLPSPFEWADGSGDIDSYDDWACRRNEIKAEIEYYEIGIRPDVPEDITFDFVANSEGTGGTLSAVIVHNEVTMTISSQVSIPEGDGPFPVMIGMGYGGGLDGFIGLTFSTNQVATYSMSGKDLNSPFYKMFPDLTEAGDYLAWSWGVSRLIDALQAKATDIKADMERVGVQGCSYAGKMALFSGAFDERIALTLVQESGGGGISSWRVGDAIGSSVEGISNTNYSWFSPALKNVFGNDVDKLPYDHHELIAMIAPRAVFIYGNPTQVWLGEESGYVATQAAAQVWEKFGISDRFGFNFNTTQSHCNASPSQVESANKFINRFLKGDESVSTENVRDAGVLSDVNYKFWISDWSLDGEEGGVPNEEFWFEFESKTCSKIGSQWEVIADETVSNGEFVKPATGSGVADASEIADAEIIQIPFLLDNNGKLFVHLRLNTPESENASIWVAVDDGDFVAVNDLSTNGTWAWLPVVENKTVFKGSHFLKVAILDENIMLDKVYITNQATNIPEGLGGDEISCEVSYGSIFDFESGNLDGWSSKNGQMPTITQEEVYGGEYALKAVHSSGTDPWNLQFVTPLFDLTPGHNYEVTFMIKSVGGAGRGRISMEGTGTLGGQYWADFNVPEGEWTKVTYSDLNAGTAEADLVFNLGYVANRTYYIDDIKIANISEQGPVSIKENSADDNLIVTSSNGVIGVYAPQNSTVKVYNLNGVLVAQSNNSEVSFALKSGFYIVKVENEGRVLTKKVVVK